MIKRIDIPDDDERDERFAEFCDEHDIAVMDRSELYDIFYDSGSGYALRRWHQMQAECMRSR